MSGIVWQDPPPANARRMSHFDIAAKLKARPGEWAMIKTARISTSDPYASKIRNAAVLAYWPPGAFEARVVRIEGDRADVYARYVGGETS